MDANSALIICEHVQVLVNYKSSLTSCDVSSERHNIVQIFRFTAIWLTVSG